MGDRIVVMKEGEIQQVDTPQNLYDMPCNMFVAGFIGSPQMNFIDVTVREKDGGFAVSFGRYDIPVQPGKAENTRLFEYVGKTVVLGIRPEDLHTEPAFLSAAPESQVELDVDIAELMGAEVYLYGTCADTSLTVRAPSRVQARSGDTVRLAIDGNKLHLFDKETERAILN